MRKIVSASIMTFLLCFFTSINKDPDIKSVNTNINNIPVSVEYKISTEKKHEPYHGAADIYSADAKTLKNLSLVNYSTKTSNVADEETAVKIAVTAFSEIYEDCLDEMPFEVYFNTNANAWIVHGTLPEDWVGGVALIAIERYWESIVAYAYKIRTAVGFARLMTGEQCPEKH